MNTNIKHTSGLKSLSINCPPLHTLVVMERIYYSIILFFLSCSALAQPAAIPALVTDRPDQTESASLVPKGYFQVETGFVLEGDKIENFHEQNLGMFTTLLRYGINQNFELRLGSAYLQTTQKTDGTKTCEASGLAPLFLGMKFKMFAENGVVPKMAFLITTEFPNTGAKEFSPGYLSTDVRFNAEYSLTERLGVGANFGVKWDGEQAKPEGLYSLVFGLGVSDKLSVFIESYGFLPQDEIPDHRMDAGFTFLLGDNLQLDASGGFGLSDVSPDYFINAGLSWRIPL